MQRDCGEVNVEGNPANIEILMQCHHEELECPCNLGRLMYRGIKNYRGRHF